jgi:hypothetical protein
LFHRFWELIRPVLIGSELMTSLQRNEAAADRLDQTIREMLEK